MAESVLGSLHDAENSPFTFDDLQKLKLEASSDDKNDFIFLKRTTHVELWKKATKGTAINLIKGLLHFPGIPSETIYELIVDIDIRREWEKQIPILEVLDDTASHKTIYWLVKTPSGVSDRDFVQYMTHGSDEEGIKYILYKNAVHPSRPERRGIVRAETLFSGTLIYPDKTDPNSTYVTVLVQDDLKGNVPKAVVNHFYAKAPIEWHQNITNYYNKIYSKRPKDTI